MSDEERSSTARLLLAGALLSVWLFFLFVGITLGGAIHLALIGVLALRPWRLPPAIGSDPADRPVAAHRPAGSDD